jgi:hypothetical protein
VSSEETRLRQQLADIVVRDPLFRDHDAQYWAAETDRLSTAREACV